MGVRRQLVKQQPVKKKPAEGQAFAGKQHHHGCTGCRARYCCDCEDPATPGLCNPCFSGWPATWQAHWAPRPCCRQAKPPTPAEMTAHRLAPGTWFLCPTCARSHSYLPTQEDVA